MEQNRLEKAVTKYQKAIDLDPDLVEAHWNLSHVLLLMGEFSKGWKQYRWRWKRKSTPSIDYPKPEWKADFLPETTLLVHTEQALETAFSSFAIFQ